MPDSDSERVAAHCRKHLDLKSLKLGEEYFYRSLPLCVVDSVFSIGVNFKGVQNTVRRCCDYLQSKHVKPQIKTLREKGNELPLEEEQISIESFLKALEGLSVEQLADDVFVNRQRTSTRSGILKADAVRRFAAVLCENDINFFQDIERLLTKEFETKLAKIEKEICEIPGQKSGISTTYFFMLAGSDDKIKPDRMVLRFLEDALSRPKGAIGLRKAQNLVSEAVKHLKSERPDLNARLLDYGIWSFQRQQPKRSLK
ncbi:hypothetical protein [Deinococcus frigens]|uniref:hypothetical protein n=1 Tax=Deinococcus frigens TaxID=249403 RepID=UPI0012EB7F95|nr:hypothetical protein [Deinococcus frigens]